jgi:hypothetical protein
MRAWPGLYLRWIVFANAQLDRYTTRAATVLVVQLTVQAI